MNITFKFTNTYSYCCW